MTTRTHITQLRGFLKVSVIYNQDGIRITRCSYLVGVSNQAEVVATIRRLREQVALDLVAVRMVDA